MSVAHGLAAFEHLAADIDRLNESSARPNPFNSFAYLRAFGLRSEYFRPGCGERLYVVREAGRPVGVAPMRRAVRNIGAGPVRIPSACIEFLAALDTERPGILAAPQDEARVAGALVRHLCEHEPGWDMLEFAGQPADSALRAAVHAAAGARFRARDVAIDPHHEVDLAGKDFAGYFRALSKKMRSNTSRQARRLFAAGEPELVFAAGGPAVTAWFDAYCDLDGRSWKSGTASSIARDPRRVRFFREIAAGRAGLDPEFTGVILDGVLVAGLLSGSNASTAPADHGAWCLEIAYDRSQAELGPGHLVLLAAVGRAIGDGHRMINFMHKFTYYKHRWAALPIAVTNVQLIRRRSLRNLRALLGDWKQRRRAQPADPVDGAAAAGDPDDAGPRDTSPVAEADRARARERTARALAYTGPGIRRLDRSAALGFLPFELS